MQNPVAGRKLSPTEQAEGSSGLVSLLPRMSLSQASLPACEQVVAGNPVCIGSTCDYSCVFTHMWIFSSLSSCFLSVCQLLVASLGLQNRHGYIFSLRASVHKPQWHTALTLALAVSSPPPLIFSSRFPHSLTRRIFQSIAQQSWSDVASLGLFP